MNKGMFNHPLKDKNMDILRELEVQGSGATGFYNRESADGQTFVGSSNGSTLPAMWWLGILIGMVAIRIAYELSE